MDDILFGNNNRAIIKKLTSRSFHSNKTRNIIAVIAIALTTFLFTAVLTIGLGSTGTIKYNMERMVGSQADALVQGLSLEQFEQLKNNAMFEKVGCWIPVAIMSNTNRLLVEVDYADQAQLELRFLTPRAGTAPQKENEVLVSANVLEDMNIEEQIGVSIPIEFSIQDKVYHFDMVVSGIYDTPHEKSESVIVSQAFMECNQDMLSEAAEGRSGCGIYDADVVMRDTYMVQERISEFVLSIGGNPDNANADNYVRIAPTPQSSNDSNLVIWLAAGVFGILFMFCGYLLIYNVFEIAVTNDIRQYGLLRTIGTTSRQVKRLVNRQAWYLFLVGTPIGLLLGLLLGRSILPAVIQIFSVDYGGDKIEVGALPYVAIIAGAILFSGLTVYISTRKPVKKASQISPIEAVRYVEQANISVLSKKADKGAIIPHMAKANLQRNRRRTAFIVVSLTLSVVLLNSVFVFSNSFDEEGYIQKQTRSDFIVYNPSVALAFNGNFGHDSGISDNTVSEIGQQPGVINEVKLYRNTFEDDNIACDWGISYPIDNTYKYVSVLPDFLDWGYNDNFGYAALTSDNLPLGNVFGFSENLLQRIDIIEGETDLALLKEKLWNGNNVILMASYDNSGNLDGADDPQYAGVSVGDTIQFYENGTPTKMFTVVAKVAATESEITLAGGGSNIATDVGGPMIYMSEDNFKEIYATPTLYGFLFDVEDEYQQEMENYLAQNTDISYSSASTLRTTILSLKNVVLLIGGMIGAIFALVGLINFTNLIMTNIITRRHEFAIMQSIGMTNRQLWQLMILESISYVMRAGVVGILTSCVMGFTLIKILVENGPTNFMMSFQMTLFPAIIILVFFGALAFTIPVIALQFFNNHSIVEQLKVQE